MFPSRAVPAWRLVAVACIAGALAPSTAMGLSPAQQEPPIPVRLTLDLAIEIFLAQNPTILAERQNVVVARANVTDARQLPNPRISYEADNVGGSPLPDASFWDNQDLDLTIEQRILIGGSRSKREGVANQAVLGAQATLQDTIRRLSLELRTRYYDVVLAEQALDLATEILGQFDQVVRLMEQRYEQGEASGLELARLRTERLRYYNDQINAGVGAVNAKIALLELLGVRSAAVDFEVEEELVFEQMTADLRDLEEEALNNRPDLAAQRSRVEQSRRSQDYERSLRVPDLVPYVGYNRDFGQDNFTFGVSVAIPVFYRNQGGVARAAAETDREQQLLVGRELAVRTEVHQAFTVVGARAQLVESMEAEYVPSAEQARNIAQASYTLGALDLIEYLDAERAYRETLRGYYQALYDHQVSRFLLDAVVGGDGSR